MHATHPGSTPDPQPGPAVGSTADQIVGILTDPARFRANIAAQMATAAQPTPVPGNDPVRDAALYLQRHRPWSVGRTCPPRRAIEATNADLAATRQLLLPCGIWGEQAASADSDDGDLDGANFTDCLFCGAPGGYPYCQGSSGGRTSCAEVVAADDAELAARDGNSE
jgi:hypothetical protein